MRTDELEYRLPEGLIATRPSAERGGSRMMVVRRGEGGGVEHRLTGDLPEYVRAGDAVTVNDSRVVRALLRGRRVDTGGKVEGLFLSADAVGSRWRALLKSNGKLREGMAVELVGRGGERATVRLASKLGGGEWEVEVEGVGDGRRALERVGGVPLPPYILQARRERGEVVDEGEDAARYQTVYASAERAGSVAAPTAGLHLTEASLGSMRAAGAVVRSVTLHVGAGTFKPVESETLEAHAMHAEWAEVPGETLGGIGLARAGGGRSVVVGTTAARALESVPAGHSGAWRGETRLLISPGFSWKRTDALLTNFHLPRSTLLAMVGALLPGGVAELLRLYEVAIGEGYRFYSYGDAMLIL